MTGRGSNAEKVRREGACPEKREVFTWHGQRLYIERRTAKAQRERGLVTRACCVPQVWAALFMRVVDLKADVA